MAIKGRKYPSSRSSLPEIKKRQNVWKCGRTFWAGLSTSGTMGCPPALPTQFSSDFVPTSPLPRSLGPEGTAMPGEDNLPSILTQLELHFKYSSSVRQRRAGGHKRLRKRTLKGP